MEGQCSLYERQEPAGCRIEKDRSMCLPSGRLKAHTRIACRTLMVSARRLASSATLYGLVVCRTWVRRWQISDNNRFESTEVHSDSDPESAVSPDRTVSLQLRHSYLTARVAVGSTGQLVWVFEDCGLELQHSLAARKPRMTLVLLDSLAPVQMASAGTVSTMIAVSGMRALPVLGGQTMMVAHTVSLQLGTATASLSRLE